MWEHDDIIVLTLEVLHRNEANNGNLRKNQKQCFYVIKQCFWQSVTFAEAWRIGWCLSMSALAQYPTRSKGTVSLAPAIFKLHTHLGTQTKHSL